MLNIGNKNYMNLQEAVAWLLENNALPFQSTADYAGNTEIAMSTLINPSPAKVRVGSIIFFADSKVSTVIGVTSNSFICSDQYNDLVDDVVYVTNVAINASGHLICTLSNGDTIDAGLIKQVASFSINGSQHLIVTYNDGSTNDLGAIFSGNITISGNLTVTGGISGNSITGNSIIETMNGYTMALQTVQNATLTPVYGGIVKNGNKLTFAIALRFNRSGSVGYDNPTLVKAYIPSSVGAKIYVAVGTYTVARTKTECVNLGGGDSKEINMGLLKWSNSEFNFSTNELNTLDINTDYYFRFEFTILLSDSLL